MVEDNKCYNCGASKEDTTKSCCNACRKKNSTAAAVAKTKSRNLWKSAGLCTVCGASRDNHTQLCSICRSRMNKHQEKRRARLKSGLVKKRNRETCHLTRKERIGARLCINCCTPVVGNIQTCKICTLKAHMRKATGSSVGWENLLKIFEKQDGRCCYTGVVLELGVNASVDHAIPRTHKDFPGDADFTNLVWTTREVNRFKSTLTSAELKEYCAGIIGWMDGQK